MKKLVVALMVCLFCCLSCGGDDGGSSGGGGPIGSPPVISSLACNPDSAEVDEGGGAIEIDCTLFFRDPEGDLEEIVYSYLDGCGSDPGPLRIDVRGQLVGGQQQGDIDLENLQVKTNCAPDETYTYQFVAVDSENSESDPLTLNFLLNAP
jgi:hypothetical protein